MVENPTDFRWFKVWRAIGGAGGAPGTDLELAVLVEEGFAPNSGQWWFVDRQLDREPTIALPAALHRALAPDADFDEARCVTLTLTSRVWAAADGHLICQALTPAPTPAHRQVRNGEKRLMVNKASVARVAEWQTRQT